MCVLVAFGVLSVGCVSASAANRPARNAARMHAKRRWLHNRVIY
jgi:hypothetical protein